VPSRDRAYAYGTRIIGWSPGWLAPNVRPGPAQSPPVSASSQPSRSPSRSSRPQRSTAPARSFRARSSSSPIPVRASGHHRRAAHGVGQPAPRGTGPAPCVAGSGWAAPVSRAAGRGRGRSVRAADGGLEGNQPQLINDRVVLPGAGRERRSQGSQARGQSQIGSIGAAAGLFP
jgi:hypothetical protein